MQGFRWQLIALLLAVGVFTAAFITRISTAPPTPTATPDAPAPISDTATPQPTPTPITITATPAAVTDGSRDVSRRAIETDGVPTFTEALPGRVTRLNPLLTTPAEADITALIYEGLTRINRFSEPVPALALDWVVSRDGRQYVFTLREGVLWHDGNPFTARDVVYTFSLLADPEFPGESSLANFWQTVEVQAISDTLVRFRLAQPLSRFPSLLTIGILPEHALRGTSASQLANHPFNLTPIGTGPYQLESLRSDDAQRIAGVDLRAAPVYRQRADFPGGYTIERMRFRITPDFEQALALLENGLVDGLAARHMSQRPALVNVSNTATRRYTSIAPSVGILIYNWDEGEERRFFREARVRNALQQCVNRVTPVESRLADRAVVATSPLLPNSWGYADALAWPAPNTEAGQQLLETANIQLDDQDTDDAAITDLSTTQASQSAVVNRFTLLTRDDPALRGIAEEIATQWAGCGLDVTVEAVDGDTLQRRVAAGEFDAAMVELPLSADPDVYVYWHVGQHPDGKNYGGVADDRISEMLERARHDSNGINRAQLYRQFQQLFVQRAIALPLYYPLFTYAVDDRVQGVQLGFISQPADRFRTINQWVFSN
jgi:peptide/nickel transport system substrate-binding protein